VLITSHFFGEINFDELDYFTLSFKQIGKSITMKWGRWESDPNFWEVRSIQSDHFSHHKKKSITTEITFKSLFLLSSMTHSEDKNRERCLTENEIDTFFTSKGVKVIRLYLPSKAREEKDKTIKLYDYIAVDNIKEFLILFEEAAKRHEYFYKNLKVEDPVKKLASTSAPITQTKKTSTTTASSSHANTNDLLHFSPSSSSSETHSLTETPRPPDDLPEPKKRRHNECTFY
jgi:hypothetical protein